MLPSNFISYLMAPVAMLALSNIVMPSLGEPQMLANQPMMTPPRESMFVAPKPMNSRPALAQPTSDLSAMIPQNSNQPTKPPMVQLPRQTSPVTPLDFGPSQTQPSFLAPSGAPIITMDVSRKPTLRPATSARLVVTAPGTKSTTTSTTPSPVSSNHPAVDASGTEFAPTNRLGFSQPDDVVTGDTNPMIAQPSDNMRSFANPIEENASLAPEETVTTRVPDIPSSTTAGTTQALTTTTTSSPIIPIEPANSPASLPQRPGINAVRLPESRSSNELQSTRANQSATSSTPSLSGSNVQYLKPKSRFRCKNEDDCLNEGVCIKGSCYCKPGFTGETCTTNVDECRQSDGPACFNNGTCIDGIDEFRCECQPGYKGERCQEAIDMCVNSPCLNGATCINHRTNYTCECQPGWEGRQCELNIDECLKNPCQNNAPCYDLVNDYRCECGNSGFTGKNCEVNYDDCAVKPCGPATIKCVDLVGDYECICHEGFMGKRCETDIDECQTNPCENNGTCIQKSLNINPSHNSKSSILDLTMYHEVSRFDQNPTGGLNYSQYAGYTCECANEFYGDRCEEMKKCFTKSPAELCNHPQAECVNIDSSYECLINASFDGSGQNYAVYKVTQPDFRLREIYLRYRSLFGGTIISFETNHMGTQAMTELYLNKSGPFLSGPIIVHEEFKSDEYIDGMEREIRLTLSAPLDVRGITLTRPSSESPFKGCIMQIRLNNQLLPLVEYGTNQTFELARNASSLDVGSMCRTCFEKDCLNGGRCEFQDSYDHCVCPSSFTGHFCERDVDECKSNFNLCLNGGTCDNTHGGYKCKCKEGYRGDKCQDVSDYCKAKQPCVTGTCKNVNPSQGVYHCDCPSAYFGKKCDHKRDCQNECHSLHAHCVNNVTCACLPGRREERTMCEYVSSCEQVEGELCLNGGTCRNLDMGGYHCHCLEPFYGPICQFIAEKPQIDIILIIIIAVVFFLLVLFAVISLFIFRSVRKARATRGTYSPSTQEKFGNSASDLLKPPQPEKLI